MSYGTKLKYTKCVINIGSKIYKILPGFINEIDKYNAFKKETKQYLLLHTFCSVEGFVSC
jgi:hypothetical protein